MTLCKWLRDCGWGPRMGRVGARQGSENVMIYGKKEREGHMGPSLSKSE